MKQLNSYLGGQKRKRLVTNFKNKVNNFIVSDKTTSRNKKRLWKKLMHE